MLPVTVKLRKPPYDVQPIRRDGTMQGKCGSRLPTPLYSSQERARNVAKDAVPPIL